MIRQVIAGFVALWMTTAAWAQDAVWIQVEAQPSLTQAQDRVRAYAAQLDDVAGYYLGSGWYGIVVGPYSTQDADTLLRRYRAEGRVPGDSFIAFGRNFRQQFWPVGIGAETQAQPLPGTDAPTVPPPPAVADTASADITPVAPVAPVAPVVADESPREARASEQLLTRQEKELLQIALKWAGTYTGAIDGSYGSGTRAAMQAWQTANAYEPTGILTTRQRAALLDAYNAVLDGMDLQVVRDNATGIEIKVPLGVVDFAGYEPPFARFAATGDIPAQLLLISQAGDQTRLFGLYEILQTLAVVPTEGPRERRQNSFSISGANDDIVSQTRVNLRDGQIKGYMLVWPAGDTERYRRVKQEIDDSFARIDGVLDPGIAAPSEDQAIDMIAGLEVRKPTLSRSGFYIGTDGTVMTTLEAVQGCERITLDIENDASVAYVDEALGLAVLRPDRALAPIAVAAFQTSTPRLQSDVAVAGYPYGGILVAPALTFGRLADLRGLNGETDRKRLALTAQPGDAGGPVFDNGGAVLGMLLPKVPQNGQVLPPEVSFSINAADILASLSGAGIAVETTSSQAYMPPETLTLRAADTTVLVSCW